METSSKKNSPPWMDSELVGSKTIEFALTFGILAPDGSFLATQRSSKARDFPNKWSIPTISVERAEFEAAMAGSISKELQSQITSKRRLPEYAIVNASQWRICRIGVRDRGSSLLVMGLIVNTEPVFNVVDFLGSKGQLFRYFRAEEFIAASKPGVGTCSSILLSELIKLGILPPTTTYLEIPPSFASLSENQIVQKGNGTLWQIASGNYELYRSGWAGSEGYHQLALLDAFLFQQLDQLAASFPGMVVLDCGCGINSRTLVYCHKQGYLAFGEDPYLQAEKTFSESPSGQLCHVVFLTNVLQWVSNPMTILKYVYDRTLEKTGKLLLSMPAPDFYRTGHWDGAPEDGRWTITRPISGGAELDMIGHVVGPLIRYRRSMADYINLLSDAGFVIDRVHYLPSGDGTIVPIKGDQWPTRHQFVPAFVVFEAHRT